MQFGQNHKTAPELRVKTWIDEKGEHKEQPLKLSDLGDGYKVIFCFQHWCPGCHSRGFPTLKRLYEALNNKGFGFAVIQTVFEGAEQNTFEKLRVNQEHYNLPIPFGHDVQKDGERHPSFMEDYRSGGTPWFTVINPEGEVIFADFRLDVDRFLSALSAQTVKIDKVS